MNLSENAEGFITCFYKIYKSEINAIMSNNSLSEEEENYCKEKFGMEVIENNNKKYVDIESFSKLAKCVLIQNLELTYLRPFETLVDKLFDRKRNNSSGLDEGVCYIGIDTNWKGFYKIGKTNDISCRTRLGRTINPNYKIIYRTPIDNNYTKLETKIHKYLKSHNYKTLNGCKEWFQLSDEELHDVINKFNFTNMESSNE